MNEIVPARIYVIISGGIKAFISCMNSLLKYSPSEAFSEALLLILSATALVAKDFLI